MDRLEMIYNIANVSAILFFILFVDAVADLLDGRSFRQLCLECIDQVSDRFLARIGQTCPQSITVSANGGSNPILLFTANLRLHDLLTR